MIFYKFTSPALLLLGIFSPVFFVFAQEEKEVISNAQLQSLLSSPVEIVFGTERQKLDSESFVSWETFFIVDENYAPEIENVFSCQEETENFELCSLTRPTTSLAHLRKVASVSVEKDKVDNHLAELAEEIKRPPQNGKFEMSGEGNLKVVQASQKGQGLDIAASSQAIIESVENGEGKPIALVIKKTEPEISSENVDQLGIEQQIGHGESNFRGSPRNRIHNIHVATEKFNGHVLKPGEEFSFTTLLGEVDGTTGYKEELVIKDNKTIPEFGGGVCQVSTTMFRVAINSGMEITERHNHAYPVQYYSPQGTDATIYLPSPDLKFVNNTPEHILIQASFEGTKLSFDFFGTSDGRDVEIDGPRVTQRTPEGTMRTVLYQTVKDSDGNTWHEDVFRSFYDNPDNYHEPQFKTKPEDWSKKQWEEYAAQHGI